MYNRSEMGNGSGLSGRPLGGISFRQQAVFGVQAGDRLFFRAPVRR